MTVWQVGAGPIQRDYAERLLQHDVALIGPGDAGRWEPGRNDEDFEGGYVRTFATKVKLGETVALRRGQSTVVAVGDVTSEYGHSDRFDDVNGWDLQHYRRVRWYRLEEPFGFGRPAFGANPRRFAQVKDKEAVDAIEALAATIPPAERTRQLRALPEPEPELLWLPPDTTTTIDELRRLDRYYTDPASVFQAPSEDELIAHGVVPFLKQLGWKAESIAVQWHDVDVALFSPPVRDPKNLKVIIEAKRRGVGIEAALSQGIRYAERLAPHADVVVTDGMRYRYYSAMKGYEEVAYANLLRPKQSAINLFNALRANT